MQEERIYQDDPMCAALETEVIGTGQGEDGPWVRLARTPFYPEGGGQPADHGTIGPARVLDVQKDGDRVLHFVDREVSGAVEARIDWERRWDFMQQHTAQHLLTATLHNRHDRRTLKDRLAALIKLPVETSILSTT